jgi:hypothetical protein
MASGSQAVCKKSSLCICDAIDPDDKVDDDDAGLAQLADELRFYNCTLGTATLEALAAAPQTARLSRLAFESNGLTADQIRAALPHAALAINEQR